MKRCPSLKRKRRAISHFAYAPIKAATGAATIAAEDLGTIFDIEIGDAPDVKVDTPIREKRAAKKAVKKARNARKTSTTKKRKPTPVPKKG